jgi:hypothetical protein
MKDDRHEGDAAGRCGGCGSRNMMHTSDGNHAICMDCRRLQEPEHRDWPLAQMCDNCAFRKDSPERADPYRWAEVQETLDRGQYFYCHKGLHVTLSADQQTATFAPPDPKDGKVCAGWFAAYVAQMKRSA